MFPVHSATLTGIRSPASKSQFPPACLLRHAEDMNNLNVKIKMGRLSAKLAENVVVERPSKRNHPRIGNN